MKAEIPIFENQGLLLCQIVENTDENLLIIFTEAGQAVEKNISLPESKVYRFNSELDRDWLKPDAETSLELMKKEYLNVISDKKLDKMKNIGPFITINVINPGGVTRERTTFDYFILQELEENVLKSAVDDFHEKVPGTYNSDVELLELGKENKTIHSRVNLNYVRFLRGKPYY